MVEPHLRDDQLPYYMKGFRDRVLLVVVLGFPAFIIVCVLQVFGRRSGLPLPPMYITIGVLLAVVAADVAVATKRRKGLADHVKAGDWLLCEKCLYDLRATQSPGTCPECGTGFTIHELTRKWRRALGQPPFARAALIRLEPVLVAPLELEELRKSCPNIPAGGLRQPLPFWPEAEAVVRAARDAAAAYLGRRARLTRAILYEVGGSDDVGRVVHQQLMVLVAERCERSDTFAHWAQQDGGWIAEAPTSLLHRTVTARVFLDDAGDRTGCLRVVTMDSEWTPSKLEPRACERYSKRLQPVKVLAGDAVLLHPLALRSNAVNQSETPCRVLHLEFAAGEPGQGLRWRDEAEILGRAGPIRP